MIEDAAMLMASVTLANHMGLVGAAEKVTRRKFKIISCSKCSTFWTVLIYLLFMGNHFVTSIATAFALSYTAIWFELLLGYLSNIYESAYDKIQTTALDQDEAGAAS